MKSSRPRRVVVTGLGVVCPLGNSLDAVRQALEQGRSGVDYLSSLPADYLPTKVGGEARGFSGHIDEFGELEKATKKAIRKNLKLMCRESQMAVASAQLAVNDAQISANNHLPERSGTVFGSDYMLTMPEEFNESVRTCSDESGEFDFSRWGTEGLEQMQPLWMLKYLPNMPASHIAIFNDLRGPSNSITHREASSNLAVGEAFHTIARGMADRMLAGATGTRVHPMKILHAVLTEQLATGGGDPAKMSRPFDAQRTGMVVGEGAGTVVLEELETAQARAARIYGEVIGAASSIVADRELVGKRDRALVNALRAALGQAGLRPEEIGHIHAHGLGTTASDREEASAIAEVFGPPEKQPPVVAAKSYFGNLGAGSGIIELASSLSAMQSGTLFPVLNYETPDPECPVNAVTQSGIAPGDCFVNLSCTPQGQAAVVIVRQYR